MKPSFYSVYLFILALIKIDIAIAQEFQYVDLKVRTNMDMPLRSFYKDVIVLDNRNDSNTIYTTQDGNLPITVYRFKENASVTIRNYIKSRTENLKKNSKTLLINILELRVPNKSFIRTMSDRSNRDGWEHVRSYMFFSAEVYESSNGETYRKLFNIKRKQYQYTSIKETVRDIIDDVTEISEQILMNSQGESRIRKVYKQYQNDSLTFKENPSEDQIAFQSINKSKLEQWKSLLIFKDKISVGACVYPLFEDFKKDKSFPVVLEKSYDDSDSIYIIKMIPKDTLTRLLKPYIIKDSIGYYIRLHSNYYLKLEKENYRFTFSVPGTMQNMYGILSFESVKSKDALLVGGGTFSSQNSDKILDGIVNLFLATSKEIKLNKLKSKNYSSLYRNCYIDMDSGDIIY